MKCQGNFVFKTLTHRKGGTFKNAEGNEVNYPSAYILKVDEKVESGDINERKFKIDEKNTGLINTLKTIEEYQRIIIEFDITLFDGRVGIVVSNVFED